MFVYTFSNDHLVFQSSQWHDIASQKGTEIYNVVISSIQAFSINIYWLCWILRELSSVSEASTIPFTLSPNQENVKIPKLTSHHSILIWYKSSTGHKMMQVDSFSHECYAPLFYFRIVIYTTSQVTMYAQALSPCIFFDKKTIFSSHSLQHFSNFPYTSN